MGNFGIFKLGNKILQAKVCATHLKQHVAYDELFGKQEIWGINS